MAPWPMQDRLSGGPAGPPEQPPCRAPEGYVILSPKGRHPRVPCGPPARAARFAAPPSGPGGLTGWFDRHSEGGELPWATLWPQRGCGPAVSLSPHRSCKPGWSRGPVSFPRNFGRRGWRRKRFARALAPNRGKLEQFWNGSYGFHGPACTHKLASLAQGRLTKAGFLHEGGAALALPPSRMPASIEFSTKLSICLSGAELAYWAALPCRTCVQNRCNPLPWDSPGR